jgi:hypothetical protein
VIVVNEPVLRSLSLVLRRRRLFFGPSLLALSVITDAVEQRRDADLGAALAEQAPPRRDRIAGITLAQEHLVRPLVGPRRGHHQLLADGPEAEQADAEFTLQAGGSRGLHSPFHGIADVCRHVAEVRFAVVVAGNTLLSRIARK